VEWGAAILPYFTPVAEKKGLFGRLSRSPEEVREENLREWAASIPGTTPIAQLQARQGCRAAGVVQNIRIDPREGRNYIEATINDGTGQMVVRWLGRSSLSGVALGVGLIVQGMPSVDRDGQLLLLNPEYELVPGPEHG
jgi:hypothetical protein